jgi:hypothetical protein
MIGHMQEYISKEVWESLENLYMSTTKARQNLVTKQVTMNDYVLKIKDILDVLFSIGSHVDDDLVALCLNGLSENDKWKSFTTSIYARVVKLVTTTQSKSRVFLRNITRYRRVCRTFYREISSTKVH